MAVTCTSCGTGLADGAKFCHECGAAQSSDCPSCGAAVVPGARFCSECGTSLDTGVPARAPEARSSASTRASSERRMTSILFGDLVGFTGISESMDHEDARELLSGFYEECRRIVQRYGGTVEKFIGDAVMAVWGVPVAHEDDAVRAVRAGLELAQMVADLGDDRLAMRLGVVTGEVAVTIGAEHEGMVAGDPVNTASRVQSIATPGEVWVDQTTRSLTSAAFSYTDAGLHHLKGKAEPVTLWSAHSAVGDQREDGLEAPFVGRDRELRVAKELFHSVVDSGRPRLLVVDGEPGLGKTRLGWELWKYVDGLPAITMWHQGRCLAYGEGVAYWALAEAVRMRLGRIVEDDGVDVEQRLDLALRALFEDAEERAWIAPRLAALLGTGEVVTYAREDLHNAWVTFFERVGGGDTVALMIDDAQFADEGLLSFIEYLLGAATFPVLVLLLTRPGLLEQQPTLATNRRATVLHLESLRDGDMEVLVRGLVAGLPDDVTSALVERAEGTPLYAVETVRSLIDRDLVVPQEGRYVLAEGRDLDLSAVGAPASLHALVAARLDALSPDERHVVSQASILGPTFTTEGIAHLCPEVDLDKVLASLMRLEILSKDTHRLSVEFGQLRFVQIVVRQVAYSTLSRRDRKAGHVSVAQFLGELAKVEGDLDSIIAQHYLDAIEASPSDPDVPELETAAVSLLSTAATRASALGAPTEAAGYLRQALERVNDARLRAVLESELAVPLTMSGHYEEAMGLAAASVVFFDEEGDELASAVAAARQARALIGLGDPDRVVELVTPRLATLRDRDDTEREVLELLRAKVSAQSRQGIVDPDLQDLWLRLADRLGDQEQLADAYSSLAIRYSTVGASSLSRVLYVAAADIARAHHLPTSLARTLSNLTSESIPWDLGRAVECGREAVEAGRRSGVALWRSYTSTNLALATYSRGLWDEVESTLAHAPDLWESENESVGRTLRLLIAQARGSAPPAFEGAARVYDDAPTRLWMALAATVSARRDGDVSAMGDLLQAFDAFVQLNGVADDVVSVWPVIADLALGADDETTVDHLAGIVDGAGMLVPTGLQAHRDRVAGLVARRRGEPSETTERKLRDAIRGFERWGGSPFKARAQQDLGSVLVHEGRQDEGEALLVAARATYRELGAQAWLDELDRERVSH